MFKPDQLRAARQRRGWSRDAFAFELRQRGMEKASARGIAFWEDDVHKPRADALPIIADTLGIDVDELFGEKPEQPAPDEEEELDLLLLKLLAKRLGHQVVPA